MKSPLLLLLAAALTLPLAGLAAEHRHDHGTAPHKLERNAGKKWGTDAPLRQGMGNIRTAVSGTLPAAHSGKATPADYDALSQKVSAQVADIVRDCKLDAKADAQLHIVIGDLLSGVEIAEGRHKGKQRAAGVVKMAQALNAYGQYFEHPDWQAIKLPH